MQCMVNKLNTYSYGMGVGPARRVSPFSKNYFSNLSEWDVLLCSKHFSKFFEVSIKKDSAKAVQVSGNIMTLKITLKL